jgi:hypothetical protein
MTPPGDINQHKKIIVGGNIYHISDQSFSALVNSGFTTSIILGAKVKHIGEKAFAYIDRQLD